MNAFQYIKRNLYYYRWRNFFLALGIAISSAVITGSLIVGDSVESSLGMSVEKRLGGIRYVLRSGERFFSPHLAQVFSSKTGIVTAPVLYTEGVAVAGGGEMRLPGIRIMGITDQLDEFSEKDNFYADLKSGEIIVSENIAARMNLEIGDELLLRITRTSLIPLNAPFVSDRDNVVSARFRVKAFAGQKELGRFNLKNSQTAPFNVFISMDELSELMDFQDKVNLLLLGEEKGEGKRVNEQILFKILRENWRPEDAGLLIKQVHSPEMLEITSSRVFIDDAVADAVMESNSDFEPFLSYFVNFLKVGEHSTPYSFVSGIPGMDSGKDEVYINTWLAEDLGAVPGDSLEMEFFIVGPLRELEVKQKKFIISKIVPLEGKWADSTLMPDLPGLSDAGNCRDWETGVPIDLNEIRDKDEEYWNTFRGIPKAFISVQTAVEIWGNRYGNYTSFRMNRPGVPGAYVQDSLMTFLNPANIGFQITDKKKEGRLAASGGVSFSELFAGLSFFLLAGGIILTILLFLLNLENRREQLTHLFSMGIGKKILRKWTLLEGLAVALFGTLLGAVLAVFYNRLIFSALNTIWQDIVRSDVMIIDIRPLTILTGCAISVLVSGLTLIFPLNTFLNSKIRQLQTRKRTVKGLRSRKFLRLFSFSGFMVGSILIFFQFLNGEDVNELRFFIAGTLILLAGIAFFNSVIMNEKEIKTFDLNLFIIARKNFYRNPSRSMLVVILFSLGTFLVISTGSNRKDLFNNASLRTSGTGGFLFYAESTAPVLKDLNSQLVRKEFGLEGDYTFIQFRKLQGDDASCLNLNKISNPEILAVNPVHLNGRFSFVSHTHHLNERNPWESLNQKYSSGIIPAIADETVIKWGLGMQVGDTLQYTDSKGEVLKLLLIGGTAPSVFQGRVIISEQNFLDRFPESSGTGVFLIEGNPADSSVIVEETSMGLRDHGWAMESCAVRLAEFNSVTNTYLSIFMVLGAFGLLLGTIGLAVVLLRTINERKNEIALQRALGFSLNRVRKQLVFEFSFLLIFGNFIGCLAAVISTFPSLLKSNSGASFSGVLIILIVLILNGYLWIQLIAFSGIRRKEIYYSLRNE